jgi:YD repeat protein
MRKTLLLTIGYLLGIWTFCPAQEQTNETAVVQKAAAVTEEYYSGSDRYTSSPQTWSEMKFGDATPNLYTGTVSVSVPVYTYEDPDFTIPVSLSYGSNGYTPNVPANYVGLGWSLHAGGQIVQEVRGISDFGSTLYISGYSFFEEKDFAGKTVELNVNDIRKNAYMYRFFKGPKSTETEPDIFSFNFMGHSGKFMFAGQKIYVFDTNHPQGEYSVKIEEMPFVSEPYYSRIITITTGDGYRYIFAPLQEAELSMIAPHLQADLKDWRSLTFEPQNPTQSWFLIRIVAPNQRTVSFEYEKSNQSINQYQDTLKITYSKNPIAHVPEQEYKSRLVNPVLQLKNINVDNKVDIDLIYSTRPSEYSGSSVPPKLDTVRVTRKSNAGAGKILKECILKYDYSPQLNNDCSRVMFLSSVSIPGTGTYRMEYYHIDKGFPGHDLSNVDHWGYYNAGGASPDIALDSLYFTNLDWTAVTGRKPDSSYAIRGMLSKIIYPTGGYTTFVYEPHTYKDIVSRDRTKLALPSLKIGTKEVEAGGLRIKKITNYASATDSISKTYRYQTSEGVCSGNLLVQPYYYFHLEEYEKGTDKLLRNIHYWLPNSTSVGAEQPHVEYESVAEIYDDGSYTVYDFANYHDTPDQFGGNPDILLNPDVYGSPYAWANNFLTQPDYEPPFRGTLLATSYYNSDNKLQKKVTFSYDRSKNRKFVESVKYAASYFYVQRSYLETYPLVRVTTTDYMSDTNTVMTREKSYTYNDLGQTICTRSQESDGSESRTYVTYVSDLSAAEKTALPGQSVVYDMMRDSNVLNKPIYVKRSKTIPLPDRPGATGEQLVGAEKFEYTAANGMILLKSQAKAKIASITGMSQPLTYYNFATYDKYDSKGRLLQKADRSGLQTCYVWGYEGLYPIAEVVGTDYSAIQEITNRVEPLSTNFTSAQEASLRQLDGVFVTTFVYDPYVGVTKVTDPSGRQKSFSYDSYGRLSGEFKDGGAHVRRYSYSIINE